MPTRNELSRAWGVTPQEISRLKKLGLPLDGSLADCERWRGKHISRPRGRRRTPPKIVMTSPEAAEESASLIGGSGLADRATVEENLRVLGEMTKQCREAVRGALAEGDAEVGRRWLATLSSIMARNAQTGRELQQILERDRETILYADAERIFVGILRELRVQVESGIAALPNQCNPTDPPHAASALRGWYSGKFLPALHKATPPGEGTNRTYNAVESPK